MKRSMIETNLATKVTNGGARGLLASPASYKRTAAFDPEVLNNRPSLEVGQPGAHNR